MTSLTGSGVEGRERRSSTVSWTGQAGRMLDASDAHGFRLTLPGEDVSDIFFLTFFLNLFWRS